MTKPAPINFANEDDGMLKKSTKPAPVPRPAVLGPFFVGKDFLTKPAPTPGSQRNNDGFNNERLFDLIVDYQKFGKFLQSNLIEDYYAIKIFLLLYSSDK